MDAHLVHPWPGRLDCARLASRELHPGLWRQDVRRSILSLRICWWGTAEFMGRWSRAGMVYAVDHHRFCCGVRPIFQTIRSDELINARYLCYVALAILAFRRQSAASGGSRAIERSYSYNGVQEDDALDNDASRGRRSMSQRRSTTRAPNYRPASIFCEDLPPEKPKETV